MITFASMHEQIRSVCNEIYIDWRSSTYYYLNNLGKINMEQRYTARYSYSALQYIMIWASYGVSIVNILEKN